jgi:hypothetical protein
MIKDLDKLTIENVRFENEKIIFDISDGGLVKTEKSKVHKKKNQRYTYL